MAIPVAQMVTVARYVLKQRLAGRERYPLVLMLEPLFRCNLSCTGCGKIQYPAALLKKNLSVEDCLRASDECGAPVVSIAGGEPLLHPQIDELARELVRRERSHRLFSQMLESPRRSWRFNQSPLFLRFLMGKQDFECTPWGNPTYNLFGWQRPCYLLQDGYASTFRELMEETDWSLYGRKSGNPRCQDCMVHCGFEPSAVRAAFDSPRAMGATVAAMVTGRL